MLYHLIRSERVKKAVRATGTKLLMLTDLSHPDAISTLSIQHHIDHVTQQYSLTFITYPLLLFLPGGDINMLPKVKPSPF